MIAIIRGQLDAFREGGRAQLAKDLAFDSPRPDPVH